VICFNSFYFGIEKINTRWFVWSKWVYWCKSFQVFKSKRII